MKTIEVNLKLSVEDDYSIGNIFCTLMSYKNQIKDVQIKVNDEKKISGTTITITDPKFGGDAITIPYDPKDNVIPCSSINGVNNTSLEINNESTISNLNMWDEYDSISKPDLGRRYSKAKINKLKKLRDEGFGPLSPNLKNDKSYTDKLKSVFVIGKVFDNNSIRYFFEYGGGTSWKWVNNKDASIFEHMDQALQYFSNVTDEELESSENKKFDYWIDEIENYFDKNIHIVDSTLLLSRKKKD